MLLSIWLCFSGVWVVTHSDEVALSYMRRILYDCFLVPTLRELLRLDALEANIAFLLFKRLLLSLTSNDASTSTSRTRMARIV